MMSEPLEIKQDNHNDTVTINGIVYSQEIFRDFSHVMPLGMKFSIISRNDGVLCIQTHEREDLH